MNKSLLIIAGVLTAFVLVALGGVFTSALNPSHPLKPSAMTTLSDKFYQALGIKSEAQMQQSLLVNQTAENGVANDGNSSNVAVQSNPSMLATQSDTEVATTVNKTNNSFWQQVGKSDSANATQVAQAAPQNNGATVSVQQAYAIAQRAAPNAQFGTPELVRYSGKVAYEVISRQGNVYVDANTGAVLDNGAAPTAQPRGYEGDDDEEEEHRGKKRKHHEEEDDDDDEDRRG